MATPQIFLTPYEARRPTGVLPVGTKGNIRVKDRAWEISTATKYGHGVYGAWSYGGEEGVISFPITFDPQSIIIKTTSETQHIQLTDNFAEIFDSGTIEINNGFVEIKTTSAIKIIGISIYDQEISTNQLEYLESLSNEEYTWENVTIDGSNLIRLSDNVVIENNAWVLTNDAHLLVTLSELPGSIYIRTANPNTTYRVYPTENETPFGDSGLISYRSSVLRISTNQEIHIQGIAIYEEDNYENYDKLIRKIPLQMFNKHTLNQIGIGAGVNYDQKTKNTSLSD